MAATERFDSQSPVWRRGEAANPWTGEDTQPAQTAAASDADPAAQGGRAQQPHQASDTREPDGEPPDSGLRLDAEAAESEPQSLALWPEPPQAAQAATDEGDRPPRQLHPLPRGLVELYGLLAVLFVLVPEWMASGALFGFREGRRGSELPAPSGAWKRLPELRLASLNLLELRLLARERSLIGYGRQNRQELTMRLLRHLKARP